MKHSKKLFKAGYINKYTISLVVFVVWIGIFDKYSWGKQIKVETKIHKLHSQKSDYGLMLDQAKEESRDIKENKEKYAREKYFLHKKGEEVFVIE